MSQAEGKEFTFWDHLEELRKVLFRVLAVVTAFTIVVFLNKAIVFEIVLAPHRSDFVLYRFFCYLGTLFSVPSLCPEAFHVQLINTQLASQFLIHMSISFYMGLLLSFPYILYQLFRFVSPALRENERRYSLRIVTFSSLLFVAGMFICYFLIFPLSFRFLATYQVSEEVSNIITLSSYMDTFMMLMLMMGVVFEIPVVCWFFAKIGFLQDSYMKKYRKHAVVIILVIAAIITPTTDVFTLTIVFVPIYILYEVSIWIVRRSVPKPEKAGDETWEDPYSA